MPGIFKKRKAKKAKKEKALKQREATTKMVKSVLSRTQDPVRSGSAGSGKITKTKSFTEKVKGYMGYSKGGKMKYKDGGLTQYD